VWQLLKLLNGLLPKSISADLGPSTLAPMCPHTEEQLAQAETELVRRFPELGLEFTLALTATLEVYHRRPV
jgi:hypothetical protein